ncbi:hypothetical protein IWQ60_002350 [Tieghemiomyces parasiticus]|uniref:HCP-like protein n=1 Tax=Tieghemiomyces parasiticus TaxID=78921 RepID=A0A9W8ACU6_9FUNG|nr:hypothetical protein IWQ60_002350 [Tieghemiomyces parasiticus]
MASHGASRQIHSTRWPLASRPLGPHRHPRAALPTRRQSTRTLHVAPLTTPTSEGGVTAAAAGVQDPVVATQRRSFHVTTYSSYAQTTSSITPKTAAASPSPTNQGLPLVALPEDLDVDDVLASSPADLDEFVQQCPGELVLTGDTARTMIELSITYLDLLHQLATPLSSLSSTAATQRSPRATKELIAQKVQILDRLWTLADHHPLPLTHVGRFLQLGPYGYPLALPLYQCGATRATVVSKSSPSLSSHSGSPDAEIRYLYYHSLMVRPNALFAADSRGATQAMGLLARQGHPAAQVAMADLFLASGHNLEAAARSLQLAVEHGFPPAFVRLARMYAEGLGVGKDAIKALELYEAAAAKGYPKAHYFMGNLYSSGHASADGTPQHDKAAASYEKAAELGVTEALHNLACLYLEGHGVEKEAMRAAEIFHIAAEAGNPFSMINLGKLYETGQTFDRDHQQAVHWYRKAMETTTDPTLKSHAESLLTQAKNRPLRSRCQIM